MSVWGLSACTQARVVPEAANFSFYQRTGIKPKVYLDMVGDTDFEVVLLRSDRSASVIICTFVIVK